jgi:hypothetical protein
VKKSIVDNIGPCILKIRKIVLPGLGGWNGGGKGGGIKTGTSRLEVKSTDHSASIAIHYATCIKTGFILGSVLSILVIHNFSFKTQLSPIVSMKMPVVESINPRCKH